MRFSTVLGLAGSVWAAAWVAGCAAPPPTIARPPAWAAQPTESSGDIDTGVEALPASARLPAPASALVFDLPVARDVPPVLLDRASRQPAAFVGFEGPVTEYHTVLIDNRQGVGGGSGGGCGLYGGGCVDDSYQRQDFTVRTSVRYR